MARRTPGAGGVEPFYTDLVLGMEDVLLPLDGAVLLRVIDDPAEETVDYRRWSRTREVAGVVVADFVEDDPRVALLSELELPAILLGGDPSWPLPSVDVDNARAVEDAVAFLVGLGHRRIGRVAGPGGLLHTIARSTAFDAAVARYGVTGESIEGDYSVASGADGTRALLAGFAPTAIIYDNALTATAGLEAAKADGLRVPHDLSLLAWDDSVLCQLSDPPLSVMQRDVRTVGAAAARGLVDAIRGERGTVVHAPSAVVVERGTTAPPA
ncbi:DNA-binding LacI/PurR family transcriptional regulator [Diaminobutyricimonas aerilata]|uniref:DNA-binding LacI/PurR family transcriptional regulator n=1 Tax=Diaminobutyricimonas aerilata TaxID=1162967 RepID=A0A2M9CND2_9MICO|nr:DNA-binding LacI/PurR family transcriptional regulator [Diaminobutyricimonas aerilata]